LFPPIKVKTFSRIKYIHKHRIIIINKIRVEKAPSGGKIADAYSAYLISLMVSTVHPFGHHCQNTLPLVTAYVAIPLIPGN